MSEGVPIAVRRPVVRLPLRMAQPKVYFVPPNSIARTVNRIYGRLTALGLSPCYSYLALTQGRKTGILRSTPLNLLRHGEKLYLVATRGQTHWARNALAAGELTLCRGRTSQTFRLSTVPEETKAPILKAYLMRYHWMAWRFFPVPQGAPLSDFAAIANRYPVFELVPDLPG